MLSKSSVIKIAVSSMNDFQDERNLYWTLFKKTPEAQLVRVDNLVWDHESPKSKQEDALKFMRQTLRGDKTPRKPIDVFKVVDEDGSFLYYYVADGNTTSGLLMEAGWDRIPAEIQKTVQEGDI